MKAYIPCIAFSLLMQATTLRLNAQSITTLQAPPANIMVDGSIKEWGDSLRYYNVEKRINYAVANSKDTLYMAIRVNDRTEQMRILKAGATFSINTKGKKKDSFSITFPLATNGTASALNPPADGDGKENHEALMQAVLTVLRGIKADGFKGIEDDMITTSNTYGIKTAIDYDDKGYLICEAAIPLVLFHAENDAVKNEWAFNFKINGLSRPTTHGEGQEGGHGGRGGGGGMGGGGRGGRGGGSRGNRGGGMNGASGSSDRSTLFTSEDFWEKFYLSK
ncbi:MAG: hypothetical protein ABJA76_11875 [Mucilaginibacter sp.]